jgi:hypothetical protein
MAEQDLMFVKRDRKTPMVVLTWDLWERILEVLPKDKIEIQDMRDDDASGIDWNSLVGTDDDGESLG